MIPRAIAAPIFPAPIMPIVSFSIAMPPSLIFYQVPEQESQNSCSKAKGPSVSAEGPKHMLVKTSAYSVSLTQSLKPVEGLFVVGAQGQNFAIFPFGFADLALLRIGLAQRAAPIVSSPSHSQGFFVGVAGLVPCAQLTVHFS